ncbi:hypothetical protein F5X98DRAFT_234005 [Xylaria grammica]|nr:hypothetical protein F5X98DRAFT_234005 [Xylaria grammica]
MAPNWSMGDSYGDERRLSGPHGDSYRSRERERPPPPRRDSRDGRYRGETGDIRSPHEARTSREYRRDDEPPRPRGNAIPKSTEGPRRMSNNSAVGGPERPGDELHIKHINIASDRHITTNSATSDAPAPVIPKAKNPELQEVFENVYSWGEKCNKRLLLSIRRDRFAQESAQRRLEKEKFDKSAKSYAPFIGLGNRWNTTDPALDEQLKGAEEEYLRVVEELAARFTAIPESAAASRQDPVVVALEAKVDQISQLAAKQTEQIQGLLEENKKYSALKSDHDALQSKVRTFDDTIQTLQSKQANMDNENKSLKKQLEDLQSDTQKSLLSFEARLVDLPSEAVAAQKSLGIGLENRVIGIEAKLDDFTDYDDIKGKLDELDLVTFNEICQTWVDNNLKTRLEQYSQRRQDDSSTQEELRLLRQEVDSLRNSYAATSQPGKETNLSMETIEAAIGTKIAAAERSINEDMKIFCQGKDNIYADLIDNAVARIAALERGASNHSGLGSRIQLLEQWKTEKLASMDQNQGSNLADRVAHLEDTRVGTRVERIDLEVNSLVRKFEALQGEVGQLVKREWVDLRMQELLVSFGINPGLANDVKDVQRRIPALEDLQRKIPALELAIKTLDSQYQHISTKQLAEHIVRLTQPGIEQRLGKLEGRANTLETKTAMNDRSIEKHTGELSQALALLRSMMGEKRTASPVHVDEPNKRRRLDTNGRHPSPLQQTTRGPSA